MPEFAKHIEVIREGHSSCTLRVDGEDFPWFVGETIGCEVQRNGMPSIAVELFADRVDVTDRPWSRIDGTGPCNRGRAESALASAQRALEDNHATIKGLRSDLAQYDRAFKANQSTVCGLADELEARAQELRRPHADADTLSEALGIDIAVRRLRSVAGAPSRVE